MKRTSDTLFTYFCNLILASKRGEDMSKYEKQYLDIIYSARCSDRKKVDAAYFIANFFTLFPRCNEQALQTLFDLCRDQNSLVRQEVARHMHFLCKDRNHPERTTRVVDVLVNMLQTEDFDEVDYVSFTLRTIMRHERKIVADAIFNQLQLNAEDPETIDQRVIERCIQFLMINVDFLENIYINQKCQEIITKECRKLFKVVSTEEFENVLKLLTRSKLGMAAVGEHQLMDILSTNAKQDDWIPELLGEVIRFVGHCHVAHPYFTKDRKSTKIVDIYCKYLLPKWDDVELPEDGDHSKLELLKTFSQVVKFCGESRIISENINTVYDVLMKYLPKPNESLLATSLKYSHIECVLFALHTLCGKAPGVLGVESARMNSLRSRLRFSAQIIHTHVQNLREDKKNKRKPSNLKNMESQFEELKKINNIVTLMKDILYKRPKYTTKVKLTCLTPEYEALEQKCPKKMEPIKLPRGFLIPIPKRKTDSRVKKPMSKRREICIMFNSILTKIGRCF